METKEAPAGSNVGPGHFKEMKETEMPGMGEAGSQETEDILEGFQPQAVPILIGVLVGILTLILIWCWLGRKRLGREILICGACDSGKTTLLGQLVAGKPVETYTSMVENIQPWASAGGPSLQLVDVPGHERIRTSIVERYGAGARGILFVVDSGTLTKQVRDVAEFLHCILSLPSVHGNSPPLMVLCNKQDQGLAKSSQLIQSALEKEMDKVRVSRSNQLDGQEGQAATIFLGKEGKAFEFSQLKCRVNFCEGSSQDDETLGPVINWLKEVA